MIFAGLAAATFSTILIVYAVWARFRDAASRRAWRTRRNEQALENDAALFERRSTRD